VARNKDIDKSVVLSNNPRIGKSNHAKSKRHKTGRLLHEILLKLKKIANAPTSGVKGPTIVGKVKLRGGIAFIADQLFFFQWNRWTGGGTVGENGKS